MDVVNFPGMIATHGLLQDTDINLANDLLLIGKKVGNQRDGSQYEEMAMNIQEFAQLVAIAGGNETLAQTLVLGNTTSGTDIVISNGDNLVVSSGAFFGTFVPPVLAGNVNWVLPSIAGTIALLSDIPGPEGLATTLGVSNTTGGNNIFVTAGDNISFGDGIFSGVLDTLALTGNHFWNLPNQSGTIALLSDIPAASNTLYSADDTIVDATRNVTLGTTLNFNHGALGVNGYFRLSTNGYVRNQTDIATNFWEYNNLSGIMTYETDTHTVTGVRSTNNGGVGNQTSLVELFAGGNERAYLNIGPTTIGFDFYVNNTGKYAGGILGGSAAFNGSWGFGTAPTTGAKVYILSENGQGFGTVIQSMNLSPAESILEVRDAAGTGRLNVSATGVTTINYRAWIGTNLGSIPLNSTFAVKGSDALFATVNSAWYDSADTVLFQIQNNGNIGHNIAPLAGDRFRINAGAGYDGAINISAFNLANNGYGILLQGGSGGANYNGFWSDANGGATGTARAFRGSSLSVGGTENYGADFSARNGSQLSVGVKGSANGGDSISAAQGITGVWGEVRGSESLIRRALYSTISQATNVNNGLTYGSKIEVGYITAVANESLWGQHITMSGTGAGLVQYALTTTGGNIGFGTHTPSNQALLELVSTNQAFLIMRMTAAEAGAITPANGMGLYVTDTDATFSVVGGSFYKYQNGVWVPW